MRTYGNQPQSFKNNSFKNNSFKNNLSFKKKVEKVEEKKVELNDKNFPKLSVKEKVESAVAVAAVVEEKSYLAISAKNVNVKEEEKKEPKIIKMEESNPYLVLEALCMLHERRTNQYIEDYGYEEYEKNFRFPNYDYDYFDKLDELEEEEEEEEEEDDIDSLYDYNDEY
jgi:hypothetical protein